MKIILVLPRIDTYVITPPLGLGYLASSLRVAGHKVMLLDCLVKNIGVGKFRKILELHRPDLVGINTMTSYYTEAIRYVRAAKEMGIKTCLGGPHVSALTQRSLIESGADFILVGEADHSIVELADALEKGGDLSKIDGLAYWEKGKIRINPARKLIADLDSLPFPDWVQLNPNQYPYAPHGAFVKRFPVAPIVTTRGCPFNCSFCASKCVWLRILRFRNPKKVVDEIEMLYTKYGVREIHIEDDNFTSNRKHAEEVCKEIIRRKLDITWACPNGVRIDFLDRELLKLMKKSGCYLLALGIESGNQAILDKMEKHLDLSKVPGILRMIHEVGIETWGFFILGLPGETKQTIMQTIRFAKENEFDRAQFGILTPLPGSTIFEEWAKGKTDFDWKKFNFYDLVYVTEGLKGEDLLRLQTKAYRAFYFRPKIVINLIKNIRAKQLSFILKRLKTYMIPQAKSG